MSDLWNRLCLRPAVAALGILFAAGLPAWAARDANDADKAGPQKETEWTLYPRESEPPVRARYRLPCGDYGVFHLGYRANIRYRASARATAGNSALRPYAAPSVLRQEMEETGGRVPCRYGSCYSSLGELDPGQPWVAVIDWDDWHGWSVGAALQQASDAFLPSVLFPLEASRFMALTRSVTDLQVLEQACAIAEEVDRGGRIPPVIINMSFGRPALAEEAGEKCRGDSLGCQLQRVLGRLYRQPGIGGLGTVLVAASGNHRLPLFPAVAPSVLSAGLIDAAAFQAGEHRAAWETPLLEGKSTALLPGHGLCLGYDSDPAMDDQPAWAAPAGSSYSAAVFSGWLSGALLRGEIDDPLRGSWTLDRACQGEDCRYLLRQGEREFSFNPRANQLIRTLFGEDRPVGKSASGGRPCPAVSKSPAVLRLKGGYGQAGVSPESVPSLAELFPGRDRPTPSPQFCVPCIAVTRPKPPETTEPISAVLPLATSGEAYETDLLVNLEDGSPLEPGLQLEGLSLLIDGQLYPLDVSASDLLLIAQGAADSLLLAGVAHLVPEGQQPSLYYLLSWAENGEVYWSSVPMLLSDE